MQLPLEFNTIQDMPRERLYKHGVENLSDSELLSILLRTGNKKDSVYELANMLIKKYKSFSELAKCSAKQLESISGIGPSKVTTIKAALEIGMRVALESGLQQKKITCPNDVFLLLRKDIISKIQESLYVICLDARNNIITHKLITIGTVNETLIHPREIYKVAIEYNAVSVIIAHNHPSNDPTPSQADIAFTKKLTTVGDMISIPLVDHIVLTSTKYISLKAENLI